MSSLSMATAGACWAATPPAEPANTAAIAAAPRYSLLLLVMSLLSMSFPLSHLGDPRAGRWRDLKHDLLAHCRRKCGRCPFTLAANRAYLPLLAGKGTQAPLARFSWRSASIDERAAAVFVDMDAHDFVERVFGLEAELARAARLDALRPALDDARHQWIRGGANARGHALAGDAPQRRDLLGDGAADARHRQIDARTERAARKTCRVNEEADRGARARVGVHHRLRHRQHGFEARERLADDPGEETRSRLVGRARPHHDARQADADAVAEAAPGVVGDERFPVRLLRAVGGEWRERKIVGDGRGKWRAKHGDRGGIDEPRPVAVARCADGFEQRARAVEIDAIALVEIEFCFAGDDAGEMEDRIGPRVERSRRLARLGQVGRHDFRLSCEIQNRDRWNDVEQRDLVDPLAVELSIPGQPLRQLAADHAGRAGDEDMHVVSSP